MADKVIVTNLTALKQKYGAAGLKTIQSAVKDLIAADKKRGLSTSLVALDDAAAMKKLKATPVKKATSARENKKAIDEVYKALVPDYLMILGAIDVIPHQDLKNPLFSDDPKGDNEKVADSDLPYACDAPYSHDIKDFTGPARVVGRLPDLTGAQGSPKYLIGLLKTATNWKSSPRSEYQKCLVISAEKWHESTSESMINIFSTDKDLQTSPKKGFKWKTDFINRRVHFINCHGGDTLSEFFGQSSTDDEDMPVSHQAAFVAQKGNVVEGTVVAAECCFGGQLYDPSAADEGQMGMCNTYLDKKAYGFLGSTTTAYGPFSGNDQADLICQYFLQRVLAGASLGRATLEARQRFIEKTSPLSPTNQKTLAQFNLYGDPSIVPVDAPTSKLAVGPKITSLTTGVKSIGAKGKAVAAKAAQKAGAVERSQRRETLRAKGALLSQMQPSMSRSEAGTPKKIESSLRKIMSQLNCKPGDSISYKVQAAPTPAAMMPKSAMAMGITKAVTAKKQSTTAYHVMFGVSAGTGTGAKGVAKGAAKKGMAKGFAAKAAAVANDGGRKGKSSLRKFVVLEAKEVDGKIVSVTEAHSK
jgi:Peptidase family C25